MEVSSGDRRAAPRRGARISTRQRLVRSLGTEAESAPPGAPEAGSVLSGWKAIASYFGVEPRTAQRWASLHGLPVQRYPGQKGRVFALPEELDRWRLTGEGPAAMTASAARGRFAPWLPAGIVAGLLLAAGVGFGYRYFYAFTAVPHDMRVEGGNLVVLDEANRELFRRSFEIDPDAEGLPDGSPPFLIQDVDGDGGLEFLFRYHPRVRHTLPGRLICFSNTGKIKWEFTPGRRISFDEGKRSTSLYSVALVRVVPTSKRILVSGINSPNWPCQVALLSSQGRLLGEYWHSGHLTSAAVADVDGDGRDEGLFCGVNNPKAAATLVVLDLERLAQARPSAASDGLNLPAPPPGLVKKALLFGKSCLSQRFAPFNRAVRLTVIPDGLLVRVAEGSGLDDPALIYQLDRNLGFTRVTTTTEFLSRHQELFTLRKLDHPFTERELAPLQKIAVLQSASPP
jgi:hypothetical protein